MIFCPDRGATTADRVSTAQAPRETAPLRTLFVPFVLVLVFIAAAFALRPNPTDSAVTLRLYDANGIQTGTADGYAAIDRDVIVTSYHGLTGDVYSVQGQRTDGSTFYIDSVVAYDAKQDIAILRAPACGLTPIKSGKDFDTFEAAKDLYHSCAPEEEITIARFYEQRNPPYAVDYISDCGSRLHGETVTVSGYISGIDASIYLVPDSNQVLNIDLRNAFDLEQSLTLKELSTYCPALVIDTARNGLSTKWLYTGDQITVDGTVMFYSTSDIRVIADKITITE